MLATSPPVLAVHDPGLGRVQLQPDCCPSLILPMMSSSALPMIAV